MIPLSLESLHNVSAKIVLVAWLGGVRVLLRNHTMPGKYLPGTLVSGPLSDDQNQYLRFG